MPLLLACGAGVFCAGARGLTNLTHVEDAAYGVVLAADKLLGGGDGAQTAQGVTTGGVTTGGVTTGEVETIVLVDPAVHSVAHLLRCAAAACRLPPPLLPLLLPPAALLSALPAALGLPSPSLLLRAARLHSYFTGDKAASSLGFGERRESRTPQPSELESGWVPAPPELRSESGSTRSGRLRSGGCA